MSSSGHAPTRRLFKTDYRRSNACRELAANRFPEKLHPKPRENRARKTHKTSQRSCRSIDELSQSERLPRKSPMNKSTSWADLSICDLVSKEERIAFRNKSFQADAIWDLSQLVEMEELLSSEKSSTTKGSHTMVEKTMQAFTNARNKLNCKSKKAQMEFLASCSSIAVLLDSYQENYQNKNEDEGKPGVVSLGTSSLKKIQEDESKGVPVAPTRPHKSKPSSARKNPRNVLSVSDHTGLKPTPRKNETKSSTSKITGLGAMDCDLSRSSLILKKKSETIGNKVKPNSNNARSKKAQLELRASCASINIALEASEEKHHAVLQDIVDKGVPQVVYYLTGKGVDGDVSDLSSRTPLPRRDGLQEKRLQRSLSLRVGDASKISSRMPLPRRNARQEKRLQRSQSLRVVHRPSTLARPKPSGKNTQHEKGRAQRSPSVGDLSRSKKAQLELLASCDQLLAMIQSQEHWREPRNR
jgi:hypothetical protein